MRRIAFNVMYLVPGKVGGSETYARELIKALVIAHPETRFYLYCGREARLAMRKLAPASRLTVRALPVRSSVKPLRIFAELVLLPLWALRDRPQILHSLGNTAPPLTPGHSVVTVLDLIFHHFPGTFPPLARKGLELLVPLAVRRARRVIAISEHTKRDLVAEYGTDPRKIDVVYLGSGIESGAEGRGGQTAHTGTNRRGDRSTGTDVNRGDDADRGDDAGEDAGKDADADVRSRLGLGDRPIVLTVASGIVHKNVARLLEAFAELVRDGRAGESMLAVVGHAGLETDTLANTVADLGLSDRVTMTGWIGGDDLLALYAAAGCFVYPSLYEGFGIPVLEAMRQGVPVACSNTTSLPEVAGEAALMFDPTDTTAIAAAIERILGDSVLRERLAAAGRKQAARFTWAATAEATWKSYLAAGGDG